MKRTTSFHLESDILEEIELYKKKYRLSSKKYSIRKNVIRKKKFIKYL